jgi:hypothetical protein
MTVNATPSAEVAPLRTLPYEFVPGIFWLGGCVAGDVDGKAVHSSHHQYLITGTEQVVLVDTWFPSMWPEVERQLEEALGDRPVDYVFATHQEIPHCGNIPRLLEKYPNAKVIGDIRDYHLYFPEYADRFVHQEAGDSIDLGGGYKFVTVPAILKDHNATFWGYEASQKVLFSADGFQHPHAPAGIDVEKLPDMAVHTPGECNRTTAEAGEIDWELAALVFRLAFFELRYVSPDDTFAAIEDLLREYPTEIIGPTHGHLIVSPKDDLAIFKTINEVATQGSYEPTTNTGVESKWRYG